ncbi:MAG: hypothetical protein AB7E05_10755 [Sphingobium sp.]
MAGVTPPDDSFAVRQVPRMRGHSWMPWLKGEAPYVDAIGLELYGRFSLRQGDWKVDDIGDPYWRLSQSEPARKAALMAT